MDRCQGLTVNQEKKCIHRQLNEPFFKLILNLQYYLNHGNKFMQVFFSIRTVTLLNY